MACFCLHGHYLNRLSGGYILNIMALGHVVSDNIFIIFAVKKLYKTKGHNLNKLGKVALGDATTL